MSAEFLSSKCNRMNIHGPWAVRKGDVLSVIRFKRSSVGENFICCNVQLDRARAPVAFAICFWSLVCTANFTELAVSPQWLHFALSFDSFLRQLSSECRCDSMQLSFDTRSLQGVNVSPSSMDVQTPALVLALVLWVSLAQLHDGGERESAFAGDRRTIAMGLVELRD